MTTHLRGIRIPLAAMLAVTAAGWLASDAAFAKSKHKLRPEPDRREQTDYCSQSTAALFSACKSDIQDNFQVARAICLNLADPVERETCREDATEGLSDGNEECIEVRDARGDLCDRIGEARYEPDFDPAHFDDPRTPTHPNPYFPLTVGNRWVVSDGVGIDVIEVQNKVKSIEGVLCIVVSDVASEGGVVVEGTDDWFAQRKDGAVLYCGENTAEYETFTGDDPQEAELVSIDGSFKHGRDGAKAGQVFLAQSHVGDTYRQEWSPTNAEDAATVLSTTYSYGHDAVLDQAVPAALAQALCAAGDCVVTAEFSPLSPSSLEHKYYARGIGFFLATKPRTGDVEQLVDCNFDARCSSLPQP